MFAMCSKGGRHRLLCLVPVICCYVILTSRGRADTHWAYKALEPCRKAFSWFQSFLDTVESAGLSLDEAEKLDTWAHTYGLDLGIHTPWFLDDMVVYIASTLPPNIRLKLLTQNGRVLTPKQAQKRLAHADDGASRILGDVLERATRAGDRRFASDCVEHRIRALLAREAREIDTIRLEVERRVKRAQAEKRLTNRYTLEYAIRVENDSIVVPDGKRYKIEKRLPDGTLLVRIKYEHILRSEDHRDIPRILFYVKDMKQNPRLYENGIMLAKPPGRSIGAITADGRYFLMDAHARAEAYASLHEGYVLVDIPPAADGSYYAMTHFEVLNFYTVWRMIPEAKRVNVQEISVSSPINAIRPTYYHYMREQLGQFPQLRD